MAPATIPAAIPTSLVGSYAQPDWLIDRERLRHRSPPRARATELWRVDARYLEQAQDDATLLVMPTKVDEQVCLSRGLAQEYPISLRDRRHPSRTGNPR